MLDHPLHRRLQPRVPDLRTVRRGVRPRPCQRPEPRLPPRGRAGPHVPVQRGLHRHPGPRAAQEGRQDEAGHDEERGQLN